MNAEVDNSFNEGEPGLTPLARAELLDDLSLRLNQIRKDNPSNSEGNYPLLQLLLGRIVQKRSEPEPLVKAHLRKMVALRIGGIAEVAAQRGNSLVYSRGLLNMLNQEIIEMASFDKDPAGLPKSWALAFEDLQQLEAMLLS